MPLKGFTVRAKLTLPIHFLCSPDFWMTSPPNDETELEPDMVRTL